MPRIEMNVFGLAVDDDSQVPVLVLKDKEDKHALPIWIGAMEAMSISLALNGVSLPRPMTHDLLLNAIRDLGGEVLSVDVVSLSEGTYYAEIKVKQGEEERAIDCRPSDGIALALRAQVPIGVDEEVLEKAATDPSLGGKPVLTTDEAEQWNETLEKLNVDDTKYKM